MSIYFKRISLCVKIFICMFDIYMLKNINIFNLLCQANIIGPESIFITIITSFFISLVFSIQIVKEFLYLNAINLVAPILIISFIRELSPVLTSVIIIGKIGSCFTSEIATMIVTEQIDALYILGINPIYYLILPRIISVICILPLLNLFSIITSLISSSFTCFILYNIYPSFFFVSAFIGFSFTDICKSLFKTVVFGLFISLISCTWGMTTQGGSKGVGLSTTSSVVTSLLSVFVLNFILSYFMFNNLESLLKTL
uniref:ABC transporter permease n=1 Tax=Dasyclonium flaccidum TaxID=2007274 RepID=A0A1Z1ML29_9FLOR|nr:hypothetical protein [Dasyclonium flaccidum]ARW66562.1 hypothetical protein [Dasyclonium flaccidum]